MKKIGIILPTLNEEENIASVIDEIKALSPDFDIYVVDSKSNDRTVEIARKKHVNIITVKEKGKALAVKEAFDRIEDDFVIILDADRSYPVDEIPKLLNSLERADVVMGSRFKGKIEKGAMKTANRIGNIFFSFLASLLYKKTSDVCTGMWGFNKKAYKNITINSKGFDLEVNLFVESVKRNYKIEEVPIVYKKRSGSSKLTILDGIPILFYLLKKKF